MFTCGNSFYRYMNNPFMGGCHCNHNAFGNFFMFNMVSNMMNNMMNNLFMFQMPQMPQFVVPRPQPIYTTQSIFSFAQPYRTPAVQTLYNFQQPSYNLNIFNTFNIEPPKRTSTVPQTKVRKERKAEYFANSTSSSGVPSNALHQYGIATKSMPNGTNVLACRWSNFNKCRPEWVEQQKHLLQAAKEHGFTLVYSDVTRTVAESNAGRAKKGSLVCKGGESPHNYGVAVDIVCYKNGKEVSVNSPEYTAFAQRATELSGNKIEWGGEWSKKGERHHFNLRNWKSSYKRNEYLVG